MLRRTGRVLRKLLLGVLACVAALLLAVQVLLAVPGVRAEIKTRAAQAVSEALDAQLEIGRLEDVSILGRVQASDVRLNARDGTPLASIARLKARLDPFALLFGRIRLSELGLEQPWVDLGAPLDERDRSGLLGLFRKDEPEPEPASEDGGLELVFDGIRIERGRVLARVESQVYAASEIELDGAVDVAEELGLALQNFRTRVSRQGKALVDVRRAKGRYASGGAVEADVELARGDARVTVQGKLGAERDDATPRTVAVTLRASGVSASTLAAFGVAADVLTAPVGLDASARGTLEAVRYHAQLHTPGGELQAQGYLAKKRTSTLIVDSAGLDPARFLRAKAGRFAGHLNVRAEPRPELPDADVSVELARAHYDGMALPLLSVQARVRPEHVIVERLVARYDDASLSARGRVGPGAALEADVELSSDALARLPPVQKYAPGLSGALNATLRAQRDARGAMQLQIAATAQRPAYGAERARKLELEGRITGRDLDHAQVQLQVAADELRAGGQAVDYAEIELGGGPERYQARVALGERGVLRAELTRPARDALTVRARGRMALDRGGFVDATIAQLTLAKGRPIGLRGVQLRYRGARAQLQGSVDPDGAAALALHVESKNLAHLTQPWVETPIPGTLDLDVLIEGSTRRPRIRVKGDYEDGTLLGIDELGIHVEGGADLGTRALALDVEAVSAGRTLQVSAKSQLDERGPLSLQALQRGEHALMIRADDVPLHELAPWPKARAVPMRARLSGEMSARGTLERFDARFDFDSNLQFRRDRTPVDVALHGQYSDTQLALEIQAEDDRGLLLRSRVKTELERGRFFAAAPRNALDVFEKRAWEASLWVGSRRVSDWPAMRALEVHPALLPARIAAHAELRHVPGQEPEADVRVRVLWPPPGARTDEPRCGLAHPIRVVAEAHMRDGKLATALHGDFGHAPVIALESTSHAPIDEWFDPQPASIRPVSVVAKIDDLKLAEVPVACEQLGGSISGSARISRALSERVDARVNLEAQGLRMGKAPPLDAILSTSADRDVLLVWADLTGEAGAAAVRGRVPLDGGGRMPTLDLDAPAKVDVKLKKLDVRALLAPVPGVRASGGTLDGALAFTGPIRAPELRGNLVLENVSVTFAELGQRFERVGGELRLDGKTLHVPRMRLRDRDGWADVTGHVTMRAPDSWEAQLRARTNDFPVRRSGVILARLDSDLEVRADIAAQRTELGLSFREAAIELTGESLDGVQPLDPLPDIVFVDERKQENAAEEEASEGVTLVHIDAEQPFWIRREDFSALVRVDLDVALSGEDSSIRGAVDIDRGFVELLGQMFDIESGRIEFMGGREAPPHLDLVAVRKAPGGSKVTVQATGPLSEPELSFLVDDRAVTAGEALAAATGTRVGEESDASVQQQVGSFAAGIASGVLTLGARRELGEWLPVLAIEQGDAGQTRLRAGVEADRLVPEFLRGLVIDAYLEGSVSTAPEADDRERATDTAPAGPEAAVLLELRFPRDLVGAAQYGPAQRWSVDVTWEP